jgi:hypothetical protein
VAEFTFKMRPSNAGQLSGFQQLGGLDGFTVVKNVDGYHYVTVRAESFDEAQLRLRDTLAELTPADVTTVVLLYEPDDTV